MHISYYTVRANLDTSRGYGAAGFKVVTTLQSLGHKVTFDDPAAPVQINFCQPAWMNFRPGQYQIAYTPWESTELPAGWSERFNEADEVWATSEWVAKQFKNNGVTKPIHVYSHGLDSCWQPPRRPRKRGGTVKFLHIGEPALRKGGQMAIDAFRAAFGDREDVHLTVKAYGQHWLRVWKDGDITMPENAYRNVTIVTDNYTQEEMHRLYLDHHVMVYPSYGEGFGLIPLQALGTGMPTICTDDWAPYKDLIGPLALRGSWNRSIWSLHPGNVYYPNYDMLVWLYRHSFDRIDTYLRLYHDHAETVHKAFNWEALTTDAWAHIVEKFQK